MRIYNRKIALCLMTLLSLTSFAEAGWLDRKAEGWAWYEDKCEQEVSEEAPKQQSSVEVLSSARAELESKLADAILEPTKENIAAYIQLQKKWIDRSSKFSQEWMKVLLDFPQLDSTIESPVTHYGKQLTRRIDADEKKQRILELSKDYALVFFYEGGNKISQAFSLIVQDFGRKYNWNVFGVSHDGVLLDGFSKNCTDDGLSEKFNLSIFPALFVVIPQTQEAVPVAYGLASFDKIENNLLLRFPKITEDPNE